MALLATKSRGAYKYVMVLSYHKQYHVIWGFVRDEQTRPGEDGHAVLSWRTSTVVEQDTMVLTQVDSSDGH